MLSAGKSKSNTGSKRTGPPGENGSRGSPSGATKTDSASNLAGPPGGSGSRGSPPSEAKIDSASNRIGARGGSSCNGSPASSDKKPSPTEVSPKPSPPKASPGTDVVAYPKASSSARASPSSHKKKSSSAKQSKSRTMQRASTANSAGVKETEAEDGGKRPACSTSPADVAAAEHREHKSSPGGQQSHKGKLKMPDGTYVGVEERNRYIRAMQEKHLRCHYAPYVFVCGVGIVMLTFLYIQIYHPDVWDDVSRTLRHLLGAPDQMEQAQKERTNATTTTGTTTIPPFNASDSTFSGPSSPTAKETADAR
ncbi:micronuclear linker histone polyprotein-like isoform X2 [Dermacentor albipictus]|uniref:micronuclear linker histone polyprotein-like isoform X2 n=1 Tax=Dermacentor albipictus TaxID=60249 RepID=UPI0031FC5B8A